MKSILFAAGLLASVVASAQDTTGCTISADKQYATCRVSGGEAGEQVRDVTFKIRAPSAPSQPVEQCFIADGIYGACPTVYGVPKWLQDLNQAFLDAGFTPPALPDHNDGE